jgi:pimeloyl-ACP methyl ester carboxylesterase
MPIEKRDSEPRRPHQYMRGAPFRDEVLRLSGGRALAYAEWGEPGGHAAFLFHGTPGSRLFGPDEKSLDSLPVRVISVDRPGYGRSDAHPGRTLLGWTDDIAELADALGLDRFSVIGVSGGGAHALACAAGMPSRVISTSVVSGAAASYEERPDSYDEQDRRWAELIRRDVHRAAEAMSVDQWRRSLAERPESLLREDLTPEDDMWILTTPEVREEWEEILREAMRQGVIGLVWDEIAQLGPWHFWLRDIGGKVHLWHPVYDQFQSQEDVNFVAERISDCRVTTWSNAAHLGILTHWAEVLEEAVGD